MQIKTEHEAPDMEEDNNGASYQPTPEETKLIKKVEKIFEKSKRHRSMYDEKWISNYHMFRGKQWKDARPSYRHSEVVNMIFQSIQSTVPIQTDQRPKFVFLPQEPSDREFSEILNEVSESDWQRQNWTEQLTEIVYDSNIYGTGLGECGYDPDALMGLGSVTFRSTDPFNAFPDSSARDVNLESESFVLAEPLDVSVIKKRFPKYKEFIKPDLADMLSSQKNDLSPLRFRSPVESRMTVEGGNSYELTSKDKALLITCYYKCDEYDEKQTEEGEYEQILKYPLGRKIIICNGVLLENVPHPFDDGLFPFARLVNYTDPRVFWGISEVEQLEGPQKTFNKLISFALDVLTLMGNPVWLNPTSSDVDSANLTNRPGLVIDHNPGFAPQRVEGVQLQPYVLQLAESMRRWFNDTAGNQEVSQGVAPTGITAAAAISTLQDAAQTRMRLKARHLDAMLQNFGQQYVSRVFQFYTAPRIHRITGKDGAERYFKMHIATDEKTGQKMAIVEKDGVRKEYVIQGAFDVRVTTGSTLPFARAEKEQRLMNLFDRGILDAKEVLKGIDYPNWESVLQRISEEKAAAAQAQAQAQGQPV